MRLTLHEHCQITKVILRYNLNTMMCSISVTAMYLNIIYIYIMCVCVKVFSVRVSHLGRLVHPPFIGYIIQEAPKHYS